MIVLRQHISLLHITYKLLLATISMNIHIPACSNAATQYRLTCPNFQSCTTSQQCQAGQAECCILQSCGNQGRCVPVVTSNSKFIITNFFCLIVMTVRCLYNFVSSFSHNFIIFLLLQMHAFVYISKHIINKKKEKEIKILTGYFSAPGHYVRYFACNNGTL